MSTDYRIDIHDPIGNKLAEITDYLELSYNKKVGEIGAIKFKIAGDHPVLDQLEKDCILRVYRRNTSMGMDWYPDFDALFLDFEKTYTDHLVTEISGLSPLHLLTRRIVAWYAGDEDRAEFYDWSAEKISKTLVEYNAGPSALAENGRIRDGVISGFWVATDQDRGEITSLSVAWLGLKEALDKVVEAAGGAYDVLWTGGNTFCFEWFPDQVGSDLTAELIFSLEIGNMAEPKLTVKRSEEKTVAIVGGSGEGQARWVEVYESEDYSVTNDIEVFADARSVNDEDLMEAEGQSKLYDTQAVPVLEFKVLQIPSCFYGQHYGVGDVVSALFQGSIASEMVTGVSVSVKESGEEQIDVELKVV